MSHYGFIYIHSNLERHYWYRWLFCFNHFTDVVERTREERKNPEFSHFPSQRVFIDSLKGKHGKGIFGKSKSWEQNSSRVDEWKPFEGWFGCFSGPFDKGLRYASSTYSTYSLIWPISRLKFISIEQNDGSWMGNFKLLPLGLSMW